MSTATVSVPGLGIGFNALAKAAHRIDPLMDEAAIWDRLDFIEQPCCIIHRNYKEYIHPISMRSKKD